MEETRSIFSDDLERANFRPVKCRRVCVGGSCAAHPSANDEFYQVGLARAVSAQVSVLFRGLGLAGLPTLEQETTTTAAAMTAMTTTIGVGGGPRRPALVPILARVAAALLKRFVENRFKVSDVEIVTR